MLPENSSANHRLTVFHLVQPVEGGVARVVTDLVRAQVLEGIRAVVACPPGAGLTAALTGAGAEVHSWRAGRAPGAGLVAETASAARLIRASRPDVVHAHSSKAGLAARLAVRGRIPTVFQPHAWSFEAVGGGTARLALAWERYAARWAARVLCVSEAERRAGEAAGIAARWTVIRNGVDLREFRADGTHAPPVAPGPGPLVVCVGRLCRQKGQDVLLRAWPEIVRARPDARLVFVGDGPDREALARTAPPGVLFAGAVDGMRGWLRAADVVVLPSRWEGMALAPLEAMACGRPVVLSDVNGARESLPPGHDRYGLVPPDDPRALAGAVTKLLADPRLRDALGRQAAAHARANFDVRDTAAAVSELYGRLLGPDRPDGQDQGPVRGMHRSTTRERISR
ncbi:glycosyltransferase [Streptomyces sp. NBC_01267]|uniref:glycosyltransferase n=1 Tax=unclassified Streptomyces TaxID=2593676 RepID=UPI002024AAA8|nr:MULTISPECIES: glycosyltransferase [unclassified Streptomyces]MCX4549814.1 glycosyltransferase [Streptomyces sp. NBC_01500]WSV55271.1 glycosyltransferase [Streptomyces sp. NBC_01014]